MFDDPLEEARLSIGGNNPPSPIDDARAEYKTLAKFLADNPVIADENVARAAKLQSDRTKATLKSLDDAKEAECAPLNKAWKDALEKFKVPRESLEGLAEKLAARLTVYAKAEKAKAQAIAAEAAKAAAEAERLAREAEEAECAAVENAKVGEFVDVAAATEKADAIFAEFEASSRFAKRAKKETHVRIGGGFGRAIGLRTVKTLVLDDAAKAIAAIGPNEKITEAILSAAREWRKAHDGALPDGIHEDSEEKI